MLARTASRFRACSRCARTPSCSSASTGRRCWPSCAGGRGGWAGHARALAELHRRLHAIRFEGGRLLHLDFHPDNVLLSARGPVVIDWANARAGDPALDVAMTWVICATSGGAFGRMFTRFFLRHVDRAAARRSLPEAGERRIADPNVTDAERDRVRKLLRRMA